jgi:WD40 repeat protein
LASAGDDGTVRVWDPTTGTHLDTLVGTENGWAALFSDGGYRMAGLPDGLWWVAGLCRFEPGEIDDIARYVPGLYRVE